MTEYEEAVEYPEESDDELLRLKAVNLKFAEQIACINTFIDTHYIVETDMDADLLLHARRTIPMRYIGKDLQDVTVRADLTADLAVINIYLRV